MFIVQQAKHGMQGRLLLFQEHSFEVQANYAASCALRCNFDVQDLRRVLPEELWSSADAPLNLPSLRIDEDRDKEMGYMGVYGWDGETFVPRDPSRALGQPREPIIWREEYTGEKWRDVFISALNVDVDVEPCLPNCDCLQCECTKASISAFADAINTGFYVNSYTTKQCPPWKASSKACAKACNA